MNNYWHPAAVENRKQIAKRDPKFAKVVAIADANNRRWDAIRKGKA